MRDGKSLLTPCRKHVRLSMALSYHGGYNL